MYRHKFNRTFTAMFWGWCVCNLTTSILFTGQTLFATGPIESRLGSLFFYIIYAALFSALLIAAAWIFIFFPADLLVGESSPLREPVFAATLGGFGGALPIVMIGGLEQAIAPATLSAITGLTAALHVVLKHPRIPIPPTTD
jgi:hypothetical protein